MLLGTLDIPYKFGAVKKGLSFDTGHQKVQGGPLLVIKPAGEGVGQTFHTRLRLGAGTNEDEKFTSCWSSHFRIVLFFLRIPLSCAAIWPYSWRFGKFHNGSGPCFALLGRAPPVQRKRLNYRDLTRPHSKWWFSKGNPWSPP